MGKFLSYTMNHDVDEDNTTLINKSQELII